MAEESTASKGTAEGSPPSRRERRTTGSPESREKLVVAASTVFARLGYDRATVDDVAELAGISRGSVFWHFGSKEVLLREVITRTIGRLQSLGFEEVNQARGLAALREGLAAHQARAKRDPELRRLLHVLIGQAHGPKSEIAPAILEMRREGRSILARWLRQAIEDGEVTADINVDAWAAVMSAAMSGMVGHWLLDQKNIDFDACYDEFRRMVFTSLTTGPRQLVGEP